MTLAVPDPYGRLQESLKTLDAAFAPVSERPFTVDGCTGLACLVAIGLHAYPGTAAITSVLEAISVSTGTFAPWLDIWAETRTEAADEHLRDAVHRWLLTGEAAARRPSCHR